MDYDKIIAQLESTKPLDSWKEVSNIEMLEDRLIAMRQLQGIYERQARILWREQEELSKILESA
jgi:hypothetical protein